MKKFLMKLIKLPSKKLETKYIPKKTRDMTPIEISFFIYILPVLIIIPFLFRQHIFSASKRLSSTHIRHPLECIAPPSSCVHLNC